MHLFICVPDYNRRGIYYSRSWSEFGKILLRVHEDRSIRIKNFAFIHLTHVWLLFHSLSTLHIRYNTPVGVRRAALGDGARNLRRWVFRWEPCRSEPLQLTESGAKWISLSLPPADSSRVENKPLVWWKDYFRTQFIFWWMSNLSLVSIYLISHLLLYDYLFLNFLA